MVTVFRWTSKCIFFCILSAHGIFRVHYIFRGPGILRSHYIFSGNTILMVNICYASLYL